MKWFVETPHGYRATRWHLGTMILGGTLAIIFAVAFLLAQGTWLIRLGLGLGFGVFGVALITDARPAITLDASGVLVRNSWRTIRIPWSSFDAFVVAKDSTRRRLGYARRKDGSTIEVTVLTPPGLFGGWKQVQTGIDRLNDMAVGFLHTEA